MSPDGAGRRRCLLTDRLQLPHHADAPPVRSAYCTALAAVGSGIVMLLDASLAAFCRQFVSRTRTRLCNPPGKRRRPTLALIERLEDRLAPTINVSGTITTNTTWNDTTQPYLLTGDITVAGGVTLTIGSGVEVRTDYSLNDIYVDGTLDATNVRFTGNETDITVHSGGRLNLKTGTSIAGDEVFFDDGSVGTVTNSQFTTAKLRLESSTVTIDNNNFSRTDPVYVFPSLVPQFYDNSFLSPATFRVYGSTSTNATWQAISNLSAYLLDGDITVTSGVTLTVQSGIEIRSDYSLNDIHIDGVLDATGVSFTGNDTDIDVRNGGRFNLKGGSTVAGDEVFFDDGSLGTVTNSSFSTARLRLESTAVSVDNNTFSRTDPAYAYPSLVPQFYDNTFSNPATLKVYGSTSSSVTWQVIPNLSSYLLDGDITVSSGVTLTVQAGIDIRSDYSLNDIHIDGVLDATGVDFTGNDTDIDIRSGGRLNLKSGSTVAGDEVFFDDGSLGTVTNTEFSTARLRLEGTAVTVDNCTFTRTDPVYAYPSLVPQLYDNTFSNPASINVYGTATTSVTWQVIANLSAYHVDGDITVGGGVTLTIQSGITVLTDYSLNDIIVNGTLDASGVTFAGADTDIVVHSGGRLNLKGGSSVAGDAVTYENGSLGDVSNTEFFCDFVIYSSGAHSITNNSFLAKTVRARGNSADVIDLRNNYWGTTDPAQIESRVEHRPDKSSYPLILFEPFLGGEPANTAHLAIAATSATKPEGNSGTTAFTFTVTRSVDTSGSTTVNYAVAGSGGSAASASDFSGGFPTGSVTFNANETSKTITVNVIGDTQAEGDEAFTVTLSNATNGAAIDSATAIGTIQNDDAVTLANLTIAATSAIKNEGNSGLTLFTFTVTRSENTSGTTTVNYAVAGFGASQANGADFGGALPTGTVTFQPSETTRPITLSVSGDTQVEPNEGFMVTLSNASSGATIAIATATGSIQDDDAALGTLSVVLLPDTALESAGAVNGTVQRTGSTAAALVVSLQSNDTTEATVPVSVTIPAGQSSAPFSVTIVNDTVLDGTQAVAISASATSYTPGSSTLFVFDNERPDLTLSVAPSVISENGGHATVTLSRNGSTAAAVEVFLVSSDTTEATVPESVTIPAGRTTVTFELNAADDLATDGSQLIDVTASANGFNSGSVPVTITDNEPGTFLIVSNTNNSGAGSLRQAILDSNSGPGRDIIIFSIGSGAQTISPTSALPIITDPVVLDGTTQPGYSGSPLIELAGTSAGDVAGLQVTGGDSEIRGLAINRFQRQGIVLTGAGGNVIESNRIGTDRTGTAGLGNGSHGILVTNSAQNVIGTTTAGRNVLSGNTGYGVLIEGAASTGNRISGNLIGTNAVGTAQIGNGLSGVGIRNAAHQNWIGTDGNGVNDDSERNVISGNGSAGVELNGTGVTDNRVAGNYVGTTITGESALPNLIGVRIEAGANSNFVGTDGTGFFLPERNVISGNQFQGIFITGVSTDYNVVAGNLIGTGAAGATSVPNLFGGISIHNSASHNVIGGTALSALNVVSGNQVAGISIESSTSTDNRVWGNWIGLAADGIAPLPNTAGLQTGWGVLINNATANSIGGIEAGMENVIAYNAGPGVAVMGSTATNNRISSNSIYSNGGAEIDLGGDGVTANDIGDADSGPNRLQNTPVIDAASVGADSVLIRGSLSSTPNSTIRLELFENSPGSSSSGEGRVYLGFRSIATGSDGTVAWTIPLSANIALGQKITATATDSSGNTSEFSAAVSVNQAPTISVIDDQSFNENATLPLLHFTVGDLETSANVLSVTATSSNSALVSNGNLIVNGSGANRSLTVIPTANQFGQATITVTVSDGSGFTSETFLVKINDLPSISVIANQSTNEDSSTAPIIFTVSDGETAASQLIVTAQSSNQTLIPNLALTLDGSSQTRSITATPQPDLSGTTTITVTVRDAGNDGLFNNADDAQFSRTFQITVNAVNDLPTLDEIISPLIIDEDAEPQSIILTGISAGSGDSQQVSVTATSSNPALIASPSVIYLTDGPSGILTYQPAANKTGTATITVTVRDDGVDHISNNADDGITTRSFQVIVNPLNDAPELNDASFTLAENSLNGTSVGAVTATDPDSSPATFSYSITSGNDLGIFAINSATGLLSVANRNNLNREQISQVLLAIEVNDGGPGTPRTDFAFVTITITDVNEFNPEIGSGAFDIPENSAIGTVVGTVTATDDDVTHTFAYSISGGNELGLFVIHPTTGKISVSNSSKLDRETVSQVTLMIAVNDGGPGAARSVTGPVTIHVTGVNDNGPKFTSNASFTVPENSIQAGTVVATDADLEPQTISYSITGGADATAFSVASNGALTFNTAPDFEHPVDTDHNNAYQVIVTASDGLGLSVSQSITVTITNSGEAPQLNLNSPAVTWTNKTAPAAILPQVIVAGAGNLGNGMLTFILDVVGTAKKLTDVVKLPPTTALGSSAGPRVENGLLVLQIQLQANVTDAAIQEFLRQITFATKGKGLKAAPRTVHLTLADRLGTSTAITQTVNVRNRK